MSGFNEESQMPEQAAGSDESAVKTDHVSNADHTPSVASTDRFGLEKQGKGYLLRKYNIQESRAGTPYFEPIDSLLKAFIEDADPCLAEARARASVDEEIQEKVKTISGPCLEYFEALLEVVGDDRAWLARSLCLWPLTDQVGFQMYKAASGEADLADYGVYLLRTDAKVENQDDLDNHEKFQQRQFWTDLAYSELGLWDQVIREVDEGTTEYRFDAIIRSGYQSAANMDTRTHLRGKPGQAPVTEDTATADVRANILASRRAASQAS